MPYFVCKYDYKTGISRTVSKHNTHTNAHFELESIIYGIQQVYQGDKECLVSQCDSDINKLKYGVFVLNKLGDRYTIYLRTRLEGYIYNSYQDTKLVDLFIVETYEEHNRDERTYFMEKMVYDLVIDELKQKHLTTNAVTD